MKHAVRSNFHTTIAETETSRSFLRSSICHLPVEGPRVTVAPDEVQHPGVFGRVLEAQPLHPDPPPLQVHRTQDALGLVAMPHLGALETPRLAGVDHDLYHERVLICQETLASHLKLHLPLPMCQCRLNLPAFGISTLKMQTRAPKGNAPSRSQQRRSSSQ